MQRFCHRAGVAVVGWRQGATADVVATLAPRDNHRRVVTRGRHGRVVVGYAVAGTTITCTVGNAAANGTTAAITRTIATGTGNAVADGLTIAVTRTTPTTIGNAVADGTTTAVIRAIGATPGDAVANGVTATILGTSVINAIPGNAVADGVQASVSNGASSGGDGGEIKKPNKFYIRRRKQILIFDSVAQVDAYIAAEEEAAEAIAKAKSRGAKKRIAARVLKDVDKPEEVISIGALERVIDAQQLPFDMVALLKQQDYQRIAQIQREIEQMLDEEEELLLLLA